MMFPVVFKLCVQKDVYVYQVVTEAVNITFTRWLTNELSDEWNNILHGIMKIKLVGKEDCVGWKLGKNSKFSVKSTYNALTSNDSSLNFKNMWKGKIPPKIKIFLWLVENDAILTKDNMVKRNWKGDPTYYFCKQTENDHHLLSTCCVAKTVWSLFL